MELKDSRENKNKLVYHAFSQRTSFQFPRPFIIIAIVGMVLTSTIGAGVHTSPTTIKNTTSIGDNSIDRNEPETTIVSHSYTFPVPLLQQDKEETLFTIEDTSLSQTPGEPMLPVKTAEILIPPQKSIERIEVIPGPEQKWPGRYFITPAPEIIPLDYTGEVKRTEPNPLVYDSLNKHPGTFYQIVSLQHKNGFSLLIVNLFPFQYVPRTGEVSYYSQLNLKISLKSNTRQPLNLMATRTSSEDITSIQKMVDNPELLSSYSTIQRTYQQRRTEATLVDPLESYAYVIITSRELRDATGEYTFSDLIQSKINKGLSATIVTVEDIEACPAYWWDGEYGDGNPLFNDTACHIRNFIRDAYQNWETKYILLGGDGDGGGMGDNIIPAREFHDMINTPCCTISTIASDLYYACLDGSFDSNLNGTYGENGDGYDIDPVGGEVDLLAEVAVGRAPVDNAADVSNFVRKTLSYENSKDDYLNEVLMVGEYLGFGGAGNWGGNYKDEIKDGSDKYGYTTVGVPATYNVSTLYDRDWPGHNWPKSELITRINNGVHIINHLGHGNNFHVMKLNEPAIRTGMDTYEESHDIINLTNDHYFFMYSQACYPGSFDNRWAIPPYGPGDYIPYDSIVEYMIKSDHGAFACVANTRFGLGAAYSTNGPSQHFDREFFDALFGENIRQLGLANQDSLEDNIGEITNDQMRFCYYEITLFGDPEISIKPTHNAGVIQVEAPDHIQQLTPIEVAAIVGNNGLYNESNILVSFRVNGEEIQTCTIPFLGKSSTEQVGFTWVPQTAGRYLITVNITVPGVIEDITGDNEKVITILVGVLNIDTGELFNTIQEALDDSDTFNGHHLLAPVGSYQENIMVTKNVHLSGMNKENTVIDGGGAVAITIDGTSGVNISGFTIMNGTYGVVVSGATQTGIHDTIISDNTEVGVYVSSSFETTLLKNSIIANAVGVHSSADATTIIDNDLSRNGIGVSIDSEKTSNLIYHNNFNNTINAVDNGVGNRWNNSYLDETTYHLSGGNWWSDYNGDDQYKGPEQNITGPDGIIDLPYLIPGTSGSQDRYPLKQPWTGSLAMTIYIDDDADPDWYDATHLHTIHEGLAMALSGDTLYVYQGTYSGNITIDKSVQLLGEKKNTTIIDGGENGDVITITSDGVTISGFTIQHSGHIRYNAGILVYSSYNIIADNNFIYNSRSIFFVYSYQNMIARNTIIAEYDITTPYDGPIGIFLGGSGENTITNNTVLGTGVAYSLGIELIYDSSYNTVTNNRADHLSSGIWMYGDCMFNTFSGNTIMYNDFEGILGILNANQNTFTDNLIGYNDYGVWIWPYAFSAFHNLFYSNDFIFNRINAQDSGINFWYNQSSGKGNFWSDFDEPSEGAYDNDSNGIVDSPYSIYTWLNEVNNKDMYPLIIPSTPGLGLYAYAGGPYYVISGEPVLFKGDAVSGTPPYNWSWDFGDGTISYLQNPSHNYTQITTYTVTLTVTDSTGLVASDTTIATNYDPLSVSILGPYYGLVNLPIHFSCSVSGGVSPYYYRWEFGDGQISYDQNPSYPYDWPGVYTVSLTVTDSIQNTVMNITTATINVTELVANAHGPYQGIVGENISFTGSATGGIQPYIGWHWSFGNDESSEEQNPMYAYSQVGVYTVTLIVTDNNLSTDDNTTTAFIKIIDANPGGPYTGVVGEPTQFFGSARGGVKPYIWHWSFGDGNTSDLQNATNVYSMVNNYTATLTVTDQNSDSDSKTVAVVIHPARVYNQEKNKHYYAIQDAVYDADSGNTILVSSAVYYENIVITKPLTVLGEDKITTIIDGAGKMGNVLSLSYVSQITIQGFTVRNSGAGKAGINIRIGTGNENTVISDNILMNNSNGINIYQQPLTLKTYEILITNNRITNNGNGISVQNSNLNFFTDNIIMQNSGSGIYLDYSNNNQISGNTIINNSNINSNGICLYSSSGNTVSGNVLSNNTKAIILSCEIIVPEGGGSPRGGGSNSNTIMENVLFDNEYGVFFIENPSGNTGTNNYIYHNNFIDNTYQAFNDGYNIWDNNYWSDFRTLYPDAQEIEGSGIWDTCYDISSWEYTADCSPLVHPFALLGDLNHNGEVDFGDINPFVQALLDPIGYQSTYHIPAFFHGDINQDGVVDFGDINPFVAILCGR